MSDGSDQLSSSASSECNGGDRHMVAVNRNVGSTTSGTTDYNNGSISGLSIGHHQHPQNHTSTSNGSPRYIQQSTSCANPGSIGGNVISGQMSLGSADDFTPEQIACMCEALYQRQDIEKLTR